MEAYGKIPTWHFPNLAGEVWISGVSRGTGAHRDVLLNIADRQCAACARAGIGAFRTDASQLRSAIVVRLAFPVTTLYIVVRVTDEVRGTGASSSTISFATLGIWTAGVRRAWIGHAPVRC